MSKIRSCFSWSRNNYSWNWYMVYILHSKGGNENLSVYRTLIFHSRAQYILFHPTVVLVHHCIPLLSLLWTSNFMEKYTHCCKIARQTGTGALQFLLNKFIICLIPKTLSVPYVDHAKKVIYRYDWVVRFSNNWSIISSAAQIC